MDIESSRNAGRRHAAKTPKFLRKPLQFLARQILKIFPS